MLHKASQQKRADQDDQPSLEQALGQELPGLANR
jgi:hypothetical protein